MTNATALSLGYVERALKRFAVENFKVNDFDEGAWDAWDQEFDDWDRTTYVSKVKDKDFEVPGVGLVRVVKKHGGEGQGDDYYMIFRVVEVGSAAGQSPRHFKMSGWYASYDGGYYDGPFVEVTPVERVVTFYEEA